MDPGLQPLEPRRLFAAGEPLDSFGRHGQAVTPYELLTAHMGDLQAAPGGKLLASIDKTYNTALRPGTPADFVRFNADGSPDTTFGGIGAVDSIFATVRRIAVRSDGRFYALGSTSASAKSVGVGVPWYVGRFLADGRPDRSFGRRGFVALNLHNLVSEIGGDDGFGDNRSCFLDADGRVTMLVNYRYQTKTATTVPAVVRFAATGQADPTFVHGTPFLMRPDNAVYSDPSLTVGKDGSVYVGVVQKFRRETTGGVIRLTPHGGLDRSFGTDGYAVANAGYVESPTVAVAPNGGVYFAAAQSVLNDSPGRVTSILLRLTSKGAIDTAFAGGVKRDSSYSFVTPLLPMPDGGIIINGRGAFRRYFADGSADRRFGTVHNYSTKNIVVDDVLYGLGPAVPFRDGDTNSRNVRYTVTAVSLGGNGVSPAPLVNGQLTVNGTSTSDDIDVSPTYSYANGEVPVHPAITVRRGFWSQSYIAADITSIVINGEGGNDKISVIMRDFPDIKIVVNGGHGRDRILAYGNTANLTVHSGPDRDFVSGDVLDADA